MCPDFSRVRTLYSFAFMDWLTKILHKRRRGKISGTNNCLCFLCHPFSADETSLVKMFACAMQLGEKRDESRNSSPLQGGLGVFVRRHRIALGVIADHNARYSMENVSGEYRLAYIREWDGWRDGHGAA